MVFQPFRCRRRGICLFINYESKSFEPLDIPVLNPGWPILFGIVPPRLAGERIST